LTEPIFMLRGIGRHYARGFYIQYDLVTFQQLFDYVQAHTRSQNEQMLRNALLNARRGQCVGPPRIVVNNEPRRYAVDEYNRHVWMLIRQYLLGKGATAARVPSARAPRTIYQKRPQRCA